MGKQALSKLEESTKRRFGDGAMPLFLNVGPGVSGKGNGVANVGLCDEVVHAWTATESPHFVWDSYRRLITTYAVAVKNVDPAPFDAELRVLREQLNSRCSLGRRHEDCHIPTRSLRDLVDLYKEMYHELTGEHFPQDPVEQLRGALAASAVDGQPAVVQAMAFGNCDFNSAAGFTKWDNVSVWDDDEGELQGLWVQNAQQQDLQKGSRTRQLLSKESSQIWAASQNICEKERAEEYPSLEEQWPGVFSRLSEAQMVLAGHGMREVRGLTFVVERSRLIFTGTLGPNDVPGEELASTTTEAVDTCTDESQPELEVVYKNSFIQLSRRATGPKRSSSCPPSLCPKVPVTESKIVVALADYLIPSPPSTTYDSASSCSSEGDGEIKDTVMVKNLPTDFNLADLRELMVELDFLDTCSFLYLPINFTTGLCLGDAMACFDSPETALRFGACIRAMEPRDRSWVGGLDWTWNEVQGADELVQRYRNRAVMHSSIPEAYKPMLLKNGERLAFPPPTEKIRPPRLRPNSIMKADRKLASGKVCN